MNLTGQNSLLAFRGRSSSLVSIHVILNSLDSFDFHHVEELLFLVNILALKRSILFDLLISNVLDFSVHHTLVHLLNLIKLFI